MAKKFHKLTRAKANRLSTGGSITENGITFDRLADGDGRFVINAMVDGQRVHRVVGRESDGTTRTQAEEYLAKIRGDAKNDRLALPKARKLAKTFAKAASEYETRLEKEGGKDRTAKARRLKQHLIPFFGPLPLAKITTFDVERYKKQRRDEKAVKSNVKGKPTLKHSGAAPGTINRELAVLSHLFNKAVEWGWIDHAPAKIRRFKEDGGRITYLTVEQSAKLLEEAKKDDNGQIYAFILIALETSMRLMEVLSIRKENLHLDRGMIYIPNAKAGPRDQPITSHLAEFLKGHMAGLPAGESWLFPSPNTTKGGHTSNITKPFRRVVKAAELDPDKVVRHTLRHTAITHLVQAGVDLPTVKRISGHKTLVMVERYSHANGEHIQAAMDKLDQRYRPQEEPKPQPDAAKAEAVG